MTAVRLPTGQTLDCRPWSPQDRPLFEAAILDSYIDTLDCPGLRGLRHIDDILAGHRSTGRFNPRLWSVYLCEGRPAAVLLLAHVPARDAFELVYLGVRPAFRNGGLGRQLVEVAIDQVARHGGGRLSLAVDRRNTPALRLYKHLGFRPHTHKVAMIALPPPEVSPARPGGTGKPPEAFPRATEGAGD